MVIMVQPLISFSTLVPLEGPECQGKYRDVFLSFPFLAKLLARFSFGLQTSNGLNRS